MSVFQTKATGAFFQSESFTDTRATRLQAV